MTERSSPILTEQDARARSDSVRSRIFYKIFLDFRKGENYSGVIRAEFRLNNTKKVFLDYAGDSVSKINLNGKEQDATTALQNGRITLNAEDLVDGGKLNVLTINFANRYYHDGKGPHSFIDVDGSQYLYTESEPYWGNRLLPMFDQPDLKAQFQLHAAAPAEWVVITSVENRYNITWKEFIDRGYGSGFYDQIRDDFKEIPEDHKFWEFGKTVLLPTYLQNIVCGPFARVDLEPEKRYRGIPMSMYARKTLIEYAEQEKDNFFEFNKLGIEFYEKFFNMEYQYSKLDSIFCPEYTMGAMEYPGAITYTERVLPKGKNTVQDVSLRGMIILHELAHMWFGNAVTMKWWDGLWLNESFADFVCYYAWGGILDKLDFETEDPWLTFIWRKTRGYREDQLPSTTHPIAGAVANTQVADNIFDGITYNKGASTMKQLLNLIGEERFRKAVSDYFHEFKYGNTELEDFLFYVKKHTQDIAGLHKAYDIENWRESWLTTSGLNSVQVEWEAGAKTFKLIQGAALEEYPLLRFHKISIAFFDKDAKINYVEVERIVEDQKETLVDYSNQDLIKIPDDTVACLPNYMDYAFIKVILDAKSEEFFSQNIEKFEEPMVKGLILRAFFDATRDGRYKASKFIDFVARIVDTEPGIQLINLAFVYLSEVYKAVPPGRCEDLCHTLFQAIQKRIIDAEDDSFAFALTPQLISYASHPEDLKVLRGWVLGQEDNQFVQKKRTLTTRQKWLIVVKVYATAEIAQEEKEEVYNAVWELDTSDEKRGFKAYVDALTADDEERDKLLDRYFSGDGFQSYEQLKYSIQGFNNAKIALERREKFHPVFFEKIIDVLKNKPKQIAFVSSTLPLKNHMNSFFFHFFSFSFFFRL